MSADTSALHDTAPSAFAALRLRIGPMDADDAELWEVMLSRLPAVAWAKLQDTDDDAAGFLIGVPSISRLHVQLNHLAGKMDACFEPTEAGELRITMRTAPAPAPTSASSEWSRTMASRARTWQGAGVLT